MPMNQDKNTNTTPPTSAPHTKEQQPRMPGQQTGAGKGAPQDAHGRVEPKQGSEAEQLKRPADSKADADARPEKPVKDAGGNRK